MNRQDILDKMERLVAKYKGKPEPVKYTSAWFQRGFDRTTYANLKRQLANFENGQIDLVEYATQLFNEPVPQKTA